MNRYCVNCKWFADGRFSRTYISPRCKQRGDDDAMWMRSHLCGLDGTLYEHNNTDQPEVMGVNHAKQFKN